MKPEYFKAYAKSQLHAWVAVVTLLGGFATGSIIGMLIGLALYVLGWVYLPDTRWFRERVDAKAAAAVAAERHEELSAFEDKRLELFESLSPENQYSYQELVAVCEDIQRNNGDNHILLTRLQELMWTYLKLLAMEEAIAKFLRDTSQENLDAELAEAEAELKELGAEPPPPGSPREKLLASRQKVVEVLQKRRESTVAAADNLEIVRSEKERLNHQIRLLRADAVSTRNSDLLTVKVNASLETMQEANTMLANLNDYQAMVADDMPIGLPVGFDVGNATEIATKRSSRRRVAN